MGHLLCAVLFPRLFIVLATFWLGVFSGCRIQRPDCALQWDPLPLPPPAAIVSGRIDIPLSPTRLHPPPPPHAHTQFPRTDPGSSRLQASSGLVCGCSSHVASPTPTTYCGHFSVTGGGGGSWRNCRGLGRAQPFVCRPWSAAEGSEGEKGDENGAERARREDEEAREKDDRHGHAEA